MASTELDDAAKTIRAFLEDKDDVWAWDDFLSVPARDPQVAKIQGVCRALPTEYAPTDRRRYCNDTGLQRLYSLLEQIERDLAENKSSTRSNDG